MQENPRMTLGDVAQMWTQGDSARQREQFARAPENSTGLTRNAAVSDLSARQRQQLADAQRLYVRQTIARTEQALTAEEDAQRARRANQNRTQSPQQ
jgi:hypothetical protein